MSVKNRGLGKGLDAIFLDNEIEDKNSTILLRISEIEPNREQPRREFDEKALSELAESISQHGVLQPLLVRPILGGGYQIIAGERRWRASRMAGLSEIPVIIREFTDSESMEIALIENLQREDLTPIEESEGYKVLIDTYGLTQEEVAKTVGKSRPAITNALRLLNLPDTILQMLKKNLISAGHARTLLSLNEKELMEAVANKVIAQSMSVRELEKLIQEINNRAKTKKKNTSIKKNTYFSEVEISLKQYLGRKVKVCQKNDKKGTLEIEFYSEEDLGEIARRLAGDI